MRYALVCAVLAAGCADVRMPNAIEHAQFVYIVGAVEEHARERPPVTEREAVRLTMIRRVATQGVALTKVELKHSGSPEGNVPDATDHAAVHHETRVYEDAVEAELGWRKALEPFLPKSSGLPVTDMLGGGGIIGLVAGVLGLLRGRKNLKRAVSQKDLALGQMFKVAGENVEKAKLAETLEGTEAQAEYRQRKVTASAERG